MVMHDGNALVNVFPQEGVRQVSDEDKKNPIKHFTPRHHVHQNPGNQGDSDTDSDILLGVRKPHLPAQSLPYQNP